ncbi:MAG TPA: efflux RND transporter periplasmic adaptor subunit [Humisphaera sp.]|jgi:RND family efflux transporter MFP subunit|nr:efflux RND transporter periplasmic adaptor subunit [Humisphaera sp.]
MSHIASLRLLAAVAFGGLVALGSQPAPAQAVDPSAGIYRGFTKPSEQRGLNFNVPGVVMKVHVKEGDFVKKGTLLAEQDDRVEVEHAKGIKIEANSKLQIVAAQAELDEKEFELGIKKAAFDKQTKIGKSMYFGATETEVRQAELDKAISEARQKLAVEQNEKSNFELAEENAKIEQKKLFATTDGIIQAINVHEGELTSNDPRTPAIEMVNNEPLFIEIDLPIKIADALKLNQKLQVRYDDTSAKPMTAEIVFFKPTADPATQQQHIRLQLENPDHMRSGHVVLVRVSDNMARTGDK